MPCYGQCCLQSVPDSVQFPRPYVDQQVVLPLLRWMALLRAVPDCTVCRSSVSVRRGHPLELSELLDVTWSSPAFPAKREVPLHSITHPFVVTSHGMLAGSACGPWPAARWRDLTHTDLVCRLRTASLVLHCPSLLLRSEDRWESCNVLGSIEQLFPPPPSHLPVHRTCSLFLSQSGTPCVPPKRRNQLPDCAVLTRWGLSEQLGSVIDVYLSGVQFNSGPMVQWSKVPRTRSSPEDSGFGVVS
jgi:hypothetical protein